ncbi:MAG: hypothetical protein HQK76_19405 [Desulfobacterales bacterium]|nr:hypothetical protein [Desulfobacterales bacterium]
MRIIWYPLRIFSSNKLHQTIDPLSWLYLVKRIPNDIDTDYIIDKNEAETDWNEEDTNNDEYFSQPVMRFENCIKNFDVLILTSRIPIADFERRRSNYCFRNEILKNRITDGMRSFGITKYSRKDIWFNDNAKLLNNDRKRIFKSSLHLISNRREIRPFYKGFSVILAKKISFGNKNVLIISLSGANAILSHIAAVLFSSGNYLNKLIKNGGDNFGEGLILYQIKYHGNYSFSHNVQPGHDFEVLKTIYLDINDNKLFYEIP